MDRDLLSVGPGKPGVGAVVMNIVVDGLRVVTVENKAITQLIEELQSRDFDAEQLSVSHEDVQ